MIFDCFTFFNEFELLDIRLHELDPYVDRFVLVESAETFTGNAKPLWFEENRGRFAPFDKKLTHLVSPPAENVRSAWDREKNQRDHIVHGLRGCSPDDFIMVGDVDEIPRGMDFIEATELQRKRGLDTYQNDMVPFVQRQYFFYMNLYRPGTWAGTVMLSYGNLMSKFKGSPHAARLCRRHGSTLKDGGWHFSFMGGVEAVQLKARSYSHFGDRRTRELLDTPRLITKMERTRMVKARDLELVPIDDTYPAWFVGNIASFQHLVTGEVRHDVRV